MLSPLGASPGSHGTAYPGRQVVLVSVIPILQLSKQAGWDLKCLIKGGATTWTQGFQGQNSVPFPYLTLGKTLGDSPGNPALQRTWSQTSDN